MKQFIMILSVVIGLSVMPSAYGMNGFNNPGQKYAEEVMVDGSRKIEVAGIPAARIDSVKEAICGDFISTRDASVGQLAVALAKKSVCNTAGYLASFFPTTRKGCAITVAIPTVIMTAAYGMWYYQTGEIPTMEQLTAFLSTNMADVVAFAKDYAWQTGRSFFLTGNEELLLQQFGDKFVDIASLAEQTVNAQQCFNTTAVDLLGNNVIGCVSQALNVTTPINATLSRGAVEFAQAVGGKIAQSGAGYEWIGSALGSVASNVYNSTGTFLGGFYGWATGN